MRCLFLAVLFTLSCGRTPVDDDPTATPQPEVKEAPLFVFTGDQCPQRGTEVDLTPQKSDGLALVHFRSAEECSGAGGEWLIGREEGTTRDLFAGAHTCYFLPMELRDSAIERFAVVRYMQTAATFRTPAGWCLKGPDGNEPVTSDVKSLAWGVYATEAGARAAYERLRQTE